MKPSIELINFLNSIEVFALTLRSGRTIIGEYFDTAADGLILVNVLVCDGHKMKPLHHNSINVPVIIYSDSIETEMIADIALKKDYCQFLLQLKVNGIDESQIDESLDTFDDLDNPMFFDRFKGYH